MQPMPHIRDPEGGAPMHREYTAVVKHEIDWWIGWVEEIPGVNCQERTHAELMESLEVTLREALGPGALSSSFSDGE